MKNPFRKKEPTPREAFLRTYLDCIAPGVVKFEVDHYIFGSTYRCVWALREYPASTEAQAILRHLGEKSGVTLRIYCRQVSPGEEDRIIDNANKKNKLDGSDPNKLRQTVEAESNLRDVAELVHKSYLMKLLICNLLEAGKSVISLDAEHELEELCGNLGGCFIDLMAGEKRINVLEVRCWDEGDTSETDESVPEAFRKSTLLARHISFLKDFFRAYKEFSDPQLDTIEIMLSKLYQKWGITEETDFRQLAPEDYPILSDLYALMEEELRHYQAGSLYTRELLQEVLLGLHSLCMGADAPFFNGHTNITGDRFLVFGVGGMLTAAKSLRNALLFNVLAYMSDRLLTAGNTVAALDELYLWLSNPVAIEYIRNCLKRVRKRDSALLMASQNLEDFDQEGVREMTKPLFAIPPHQFLFNPGSIGRRFYMDMLQLDEAEFELIRHARRGECLFKCGAERYLPAAPPPTLGTAFMNGRSAPVPPPSRTKTAT